MKHDTRHLIWKKKVYIFIYFFVSVLQSAHIEIFSVTHRRFFVDFIKTELVKDEEVMINSSILFCHRFFEHFIWPVRPRCETGLAQRRILTEHRKKNVFRIGIYKVRLKMFRISFLRSSSDKNFSNLLDWRRQNCA